MHTGKPEQRIDVRDWIEAYAATLLHDKFLKQLTERLNDQLAADLPEVNADPGIQRDLAASTHDILRTFLVVSSKDPYGQLAFPPAALDLARTLAQRGHDVGLMLRMYRIGQRVFWKELMALIGDAIADSDLRMAVLQFLWDRMSRSLEENIEVLVGVHTEETEQRMRGALLRRTEAVHAILRGESPGLDIASKHLGHNLHRHQVGLVLWAADSARDPEPNQRLEALAREVADSVDAAVPLTIQAGARVVWAWLATGAEPELDRIHYCSILHQHPDLRVAAGVPGRGIAGFRDSHREALRAQRVAVETCSANAVTLYRDVEVISCLSADREALHALVARELGALGGRGRTLARLRETVLTYLRQGSSARAAADVLGVHKNTVLYRLRQAEDLLEHGVDERRLALELALLAATTYGQAVPTDG